jgi:hypothetical protein
MNKTKSAVLAPALFALSALLAVPGLATAGSPAPKFGDYQAKGFLSDYSKITAAPDNAGAYRFRKAGTDFRKYHKLLVDRIQIFFKDDSEYKGIDADELKALTDYFYNAIETKIGKNYPMVAQAGPDVLRLRIAVTDLVPNKPEASVTTLVVPFLWVGEAGAGAAKSEVGTTPFTGQATIEFEALDSTSSEQLAAYIETRNAKKYNWSKGVSEGVSSYMKAYSKWDYTKQAIDSWVDLLRKRLDEAHGKTSK